MVLDLSNLSRISIRRRPKKRVGRGQGSGKGSHTTGRGSKGQKIRGKVRLYFEGGQLPITKRIPHKKGFKKFLGWNKATLKLSVFNIFEDNQVVTTYDLIDRGIIDSRTSRVKVVIGGLLQKKLRFKNIVFSENAQKQVLEGGSQII